MNPIVEYYRDSTDFDGYIIIDDKQNVYESTSSVNVIGIALDCSREVGGETEVYRVAMTGPYHETPGKRIAQSVDWELNARQLMG